MSEPTPTPSLYDRTSDGLKYSAEEEIRTLSELLAEARAERDAALAALERVRVLCDHEGEDDNYWGDYLTLGGAVRAAAALPEEG